MWRLTATLGSPETSAGASGRVIFSGVRRRRRGPREELSFLFNSLPTLETAYTARRAVSGAPLAALENPEDRVPSTSGRTHNRIRSPRQGKSAKWIRNFGKRIGSEGWARGSQSRTRRLPVDCLSCSRGESGLPRAGWGTDWEWFLRGPSPGVEQSTQNCALNVKVKKFNQARVNGGSNYDSLKGTGLAESAGKEDPVELDSSPTLFSPASLRFDPPHQKCTNGRHTGALRAPWGASLDGQFPLDKTHTRARACVRAFRRARRALVGALVERSSGARGALVLGAPRALFRRSLGASGYHHGTTWAFYASPVLSWWHKVITQKHGHS
ncbi:hypothetical protein DCAR_0622690 [Daucus carota subsp. sativus]|uniref:Uncharacterized protein n=1 Tax=Daucus carota subsp. sativus TaxID=79200 RepID=A0AAF0XAD9_DAUCS|nr:hypothetical protein DCAR_0622690 [Daucus carota subsp. sativus]